MGRKAVKICGLILLFLIRLAGFPVEGVAQEAGETTGMDTLTFAASGSLGEAAAASGDSAFVPVKSLPAAATAFNPNSTRAVLYAIIPGMGQIYNRKYWKLPLVYGGFMGFMYAVTWNNKNYQDYGAAYKSILADAAAYSRLVEESGGNPVDYAFDKAWTDLVSTTDYPSVVNNSSYQNLFKSRKDFFRRNRDLSLILTACFYLITVVDAYVDAELFDFDIAPDLSLRVTPVVSPQTQYSLRHIGVNCSIAF
ncbi:MAG: hypothetical protein MdMp024_0990 [Bacteroidales bacterium]